MKVDPLPPAEPPRDPVPDRIRAMAATRGGAEAVVCGDRRMDWATFDARVCRVANSLIAAGVGKGDTVAVLAATSIEYVELFIGTLRAGACFTPLSTMASPAALAGMMADCGAGIIFVSAATRDLAELALRATPDATRVALDFAENGFIPYAEWLSADETDPMIRVAYSDPFNIIYSSGTTGTPKGILHDHMMRAIQMGRGEDNGYGTSTRTLLSTPLYSNTTIVALMPTLVNGGTVVLQPKFDARAWLELAERERITHAMLVPVQYRRILDVPDFDQFDLSAMEAKFSTSAPLRADVKRAALDRWPGRLTEYYGLTEGGATFVLEAHNHPDKLDTVGLPLPGTEVALIDDQGVPVEQGEIGEIVGRSTTMMAGYWNLPDKTAEYIWTGPDGAAFFRSGDMGWLDKDGFLHLSDRKKDMIISGGLNVYANDLELVLLEHPEVRDAAVIGVPSEKWGETPLGLVVADGDPEQILAWANERLGKSQRLSRVELRDDLPRSQIGKILKRELRAPYLEGS